MTPRPGRRRTLPWARVIPVLFVILLDIVVGAAPADAHADLQSSSPAAGSVLPSPPRAVSLQFSESVSLVPRSVVVLDERGDRVDSADAHHLGSAETVVAATLRPRLAVGTYTVVWRVISDDSHPASGSFTFGVGVTPMPPTSPGVAGDRAVTALHWVAELLALSGAIVLAGSAFFLVFLWPEGRAVRRVRRVLAAALVTTLVGNLLLVLVEEPYGGGGSARDLLDPALLATTAGTTAGRLTMLRLAVLLGAFLWWRHRDRAGGLPSRVDVVGLWLLVAVTHAVAGHPGHTTLPLVTSLVDVVHLTAVGTWVGGLVVLGGAYLRPEAADLAQPPDLAQPDVLPRWSQVAATAVGAIVLTGALSALVGLGSWGALVGTTYGRLVLGKAAGLLAVLGVAAFSRRLAARVVRGSTEQRLSRLVASEAIGAVAILGLSAALVSTAPGRDTFVPAWSTTVTARGGTLTVRLRVVVRPPAPGFEGLTVEASRPDGRAAPIEAARVRFVNVAQHIGPMEYPVAATGGAVEDVLVSVPGPGRWDVDLSVQVDGTWVSGAFAYDVG